MHYNQVLVPRTMQSYIKEKVGIHVFETLP